MRDVTCLVGQISMRGLLQEPPDEHLSLSILSFQISTAASVRTLRNYL